jgi:REP element-mobilizing transposase RayT
MVSGGFAFKPAHRATLEISFAETCAFRSWALWALNIRGAHIHAVVSGDAKPEAIMHALKANGTRLLRERTGLAPDQKVWARHGSTRYLWNADAVAAAVDYTLNRQGAALPGSGLNNWRRESIE